MAFDPKKYAAGKPTQSTMFDPAAYAAGGSAKRDSGYDVASGAVRSVAEGMTAGVSESAMTRGRARQIAREQTAESRDFPAGLRSGRAAKGLESDPQYRESVEKRLPEATEQAAQERLAWKERHPYIDVGSQTVGAVIPTPVNIGAKIYKTGRALSGAAKLGKGAKLTSRVGREAAAGVGAGAGFQAMRSTALGDVGLDEHEPGIATSAGVGGAISGAIPVAGRVLPILGRGAVAAAKIPGNAALKIASAASGLTKDEIRVYATRNKEVRKIVEKFGTDIPAAADDMRRNWTAKIKQVRESMNAKIKKALGGAETQQNIDVEPMVARLNVLKARINPKTRPVDIEQIDELIELVEGAATNGRVNIAELHDLKQVLQERSGRAYNKGGQMFLTGNKSQQAAKESAGIARKTLDGMSDELKDANAVLSKLHRLQDDANMNLFTSGKPEAAVMAAGAGANLRNAALLRRLGKLTGGDPLREAQNLRAARTFGEASIFPADTTGKTATRLIGSTVIGGVLGGPIGAVIGGAATSPAALKTAINAGQLPVRAILALAGGAKSLSAPVIAKAHKILQTDRGKMALIRLMTPDSERAESKKKPAKGPERWARAGAQKLDIDGDLADELLSSKKGKRLLIEASDLPRGHRGLKRINDKIQKGNWKK